jgi:hypothetical protein
MLIFYVQHFSIYLLHNIFMYILFVLTVYVVFLYLFLLSLVPSPPQLVSEPIYDSETLIIMALLLRVTTHFV